MKQTLQRIKHRSGVIVLYANVWLTGRLTTEALATEKDGRRLPDGELAAAASRRTTEKISHDKLKIKSREERNEINTKLRQHHVLMSSSLWTSPRRWPLPTRFCS